jgi:hypothetical protein
MRRNLRVCRVCDGNLFLGCNRIAKIGFRTAGGAGLSNRLASIKTFGFENRLAWLRTVPRRAAIVESALVWSSYRVAIVSISEIYCFPFLKDRGNLFAIAGRVDASIGKGLGGSLSDTTCRSF